MTDSTPALQRLLNRYAGVTRHHYLPGTDRREDDATHSLSVAVLCWHYHARFAHAGLSLEKILKYALLHDLVEVYAGDVATHASAEARAQKVHDEAHALEQLRHDLADDQAILHYIEHYEQKHDDESLFVWTCDKIQAYTQGALDNWRAYYEFPVTRQMFTDTIRRHVEQSSPVLRAHFTELAERWIAEYPDIT